MFDARERNEILTTIRTTRTDGMRLSDHFTACGSFLSDPEQQRIHFDDLNALKKESPDFLAAALAHSYPALHLRSILALIVSRANLKLWTLREMAW